MNARNRQALAYYKHRARLRFTWLVALLFHMSNLTLTTKE